MRIAVETSLETIKQKIVSIIGQEHIFFSLITDLSLQVTNQDILFYPPTEKEPLLTKLLKTKGYVRHCLTQTHGFMLTNTHHISPVKKLSPPFCTSI